MKTIRIDRVFEDPAAIRALVERHGPYRAMASYLPLSATVDQQTSNVAPWFRGTWAANGRPLVDGAELVLYHPPFIEAAARLFETSDVIPNTIAVNVNAPMPAGAVHVDIPSFRGATRDRYPIQLLQAMGSSGLFERWRIVEAGAVVWFYDGAGGAFDYWPRGLEGAMRSERAPLTNRALVADNDRMYHRIGCVGEPSPATPALSRDARIEHRGADGWCVTEGGRDVRRYVDDEIRISILWKGRIDSTTAGVADDLTPDHIAERFGRDLGSRGIAAATSASALRDSGWLDLVHATYYTPIDSSWVVSESETLSRDRSPNCKTFSNDPTV